MWKRLVRLWAVVRGDARLLWFALQHPQSPPWLKLGVVALVLYALSPIDLIPDFIPVFGVVDDLVLIPLAMRFLYRRLPEWLRAEVEQRAAGASGRRAAGATGAASGPQRRATPPADVIDMPR